MKTKKKLSVKSVLAIALCAVMLMVTACSKQEAQGGNEKDGDGIWHRTDKTWIRR
ncbi:hypothetical protein WJ0W_005373 [Paenibacillus melissococcoides]|uniref:Lipoprotein n=1 Tax=Paenibacillus melissococcoides TaxID=2912268 RepID=A0ABM9G863_9BACL|nr:MULTISPECIES: hypothetical protein [Paenibacillus]MEB9896451.1 hypothetical protein [Bacillus cereus]CAH8248118.1 hypothetical protein WJ0W_005373 [Paenibacillus melissococcoides]CAH8718423.1 hypothetical protein HTL2_005273 [Paenibacillus melissococcoides]CAH8718695.1 hypothetical protein WDD9_005301 [Paenibacillus melissococcoides]GIO78284.1 hypothetical protein J6TS7_18940 [Paenibacillus dendritiformis]